MYNAPVKLTPITVNGSIICTWCFGTGGRFGAFPHSLLHTTQCLNMFLTHCRYPKSVGYMSQCCLFQCGNVSHGHAISSVSLCFLGKRKGNLVEWETGALCILPLQQIIPYRVVLLRGDELDWRLVGSLGKTSCWVAVIQDWLSSFAVSGPVTLDNVAFKLLIKCNTTLYSLFSLLYLLMSIH